MATRTYQRITIWVITIALAVGGLGVYFMIIMQNNSSQAQQAADQAKVDAAQAQSLAQVAQTQDTTAYKVDGKVAQLQAQDLKVGDGTTVKAGDSIKVHYKGTIAQTGVKFDSSYDRGEPIDISLNNVIPGWQQGVPGMKVGGKRRLIIPASLAYGDQSPSPSIPKNSDLVFELEVLAANPTTAKTQ